jgi:hypothetical protein
MLFLAGLFVGFTLGFFTAALCFIAAKGSDDRIDHLSDSGDRKIRDAA